MRGRKKTPEKNKFIHNFFAVFFRHSQSTALHTRNKKESYTHRGGESRAVSALHATAMCVLGSQFAIKKIVYENVPTNASRAYMHTQEESKVPKKKLCIFWQRRRRRERERRESNTPNPKKANNISNNSTSNNNM